jgi:hypothetical protein
VFFSLVDAIKRIITGGVEYDKKRAKKVCLYLEQIYNTLQRLTNDWDPYHGQLSHLEQTIFEIDYIYQYSLRINDYIYKEEYGKEWTR